MSDSIPISPTVGSSASSTKISPADSGSSTPENADIKGFTAVLAGYTSTEPDVAEHQVDENIAELMQQLLPGEAVLDGNSLPQADDAVMWQAVLLMQPEVANTTNNPVTTLQHDALLNGHRRSVLNPSMLNQGFLSNLSMQPKEPGTSIPANLNTNNITAQLAAAHFTNAGNESLLLNVDEQVLPVQSPTSTFSQGLAAVGLGTATQAAATQTQMAPLNMGQNAWETNLGSRLQMMISQNVQSAEIRLDPPELGALDIKIKVSNDVASVNITSPHNQVREALETAVPRLREMFAESGLSLGDVNVRQESFAQQQNSDQPEEGASASNTDMNHEDVTQTVSRKIVSDNLLDAYV